MDEDKGMEERGRWKRRARISGKKGALGLPSRCKRSLFIDVSADSSEGLLKKGRLNVKEGGFRRNLSLAEAASQPCQPL